MAVLLVVWQPRGETLSEAHFRVPHSWEEALKRKGAPVSVVVHESDVGVWLEGHGLITTR